MHTTLLYWHLAIAWWQCETPFAQNAKKVNPSNIGQYMVFVPGSWFNTLCSFASGEDGRILLQVPMRWTWWVPGWPQNAIWPLETPDIYENFGMVSPAFQMSIEGSSDKDSVNHKWPMTNSIMSMMLSIQKSQWTNEIQGDLGWITLWGGTFRERKGFCVPGSQWTRALTL